MPWFDFEYIFLAMIVWKYLCFFLVCCSAASNNKIKKDPMLACHSIVVTCLNLENNKDLISGHANLKNTLLVAFDKSEKNSISFY